MLWYTVFNSQFWIIVAGMLFALLTVIAKSRCRLFRCWGIEIQRDTRAEDREEMARLQNMVQRQRQPSTEYAPVPLQSPLGVSTPTTNQNNNTFFQLPNIDLREEKSSGSSDVRL